LARLKFELKNPCQFLADFWEWITRIKI